MSSNFSQFVESQLMQLNGMTEKITVDYIVALAKKAKSAGQLATSLQNDAGIDVSSTAGKRFAETVFQNAPAQVTSRAQVEQQQRKAQAKATRRELEMNEAYRLLLDEVDKSDTKKSKKAKLSDSSGAGTGAGGDSSTKLQRQSSKQYRKRRDDNDDDDDDNNDNDYDNRADNASRNDSAILAAGTSATTTATETDEEKYAREARDIAEFEERLKDRDKRKTKKVAENLGSKDAQAEAKQRAEMVAEDGGEAYVPRLRVEARREYLKKREPQQLKLLRAAIHDEEFLFKGVELSKAEQMERELNKQILAAAERRVNLTDKVEGYQMPEDEFDERGKLNKDSQLDKLRARYTAPDNEVFVIDAEQKEWEEAQMQRVATNYGSKDAAAAAAANAASSYDYVFDAQIDFVRDLTAQQLERDDADADATNDSKPPRTAAEAAQKEHASLQETRRSLPIFQYRDELIKAVQDHQVLIIVGETGSGKTTQITQYMHEAGFTKDGLKVGCTQPRRVAAMSVAKRVADEMGVKLGNEVGYSIRFEDATSDRTIIKYMTDGMLLREFLGEPDLASYSVMMIDEAHERTLHTDILFGLVKDISRYRKDLKLVISSATLEAESFSSYFDGAPIFKIPGRRYPVDIFYTKAPEADYLDAAIVTTLQVHITQPPGDILVFLTGQEEVDAAAETLAHRTRGLGTKIRELIVARIYSTLPADLQAKIFEPTPPNARKVVLATNIAETSLTIDGIVYVIDPGFQKQKSYNPRTAMESLIVTPISRASSKQRAGRAGRTQPGKCFRLYTQWAYANELDESPIPEIQRTNLGNVVLLLKSLGINDLINFDFMSPPPAETLIRALEELYSLGALNDRGELTKLGRRMAEFPLEPKLSKVLVASEKYKCSLDVLTIIAMLNTNNAVFYAPKDKKIHADTAREGFFKPSGDHMTLLNVYQQWADTNYSTQWCFENFIQHRSMKRARDVYDQILQLCERVEIEPVSAGGDDVPVRKALCSGFFGNSARLKKGGAYRVGKTKTEAAIHPASALKDKLPKWVVYTELVFTTKEFMRNVSVIEAEWLIECAPHIYTRENLDKDK